MEFCRICLTDTNLNIYLNSSDNDSILFSDKLKAICEIKIDDNDLLPTLLCDTCGTKIQQFYEFKMLCLQSNLLLNSHKNELNQLFIHKLRRQLFPDLNCTDLKQEIKEETNDLNLYDDTQLPNLKENELILEDKSSITLENELIFFDETKNGELPQINNTININTTPKIRNKSTKKIYRSKNKALTTSTKTNSAECEDKLRCHICDETFDNSGEFSRHITIHVNANEEHRFECEKCMKTFGTKDSIRRHINRFVTHYQYKCDKCDKIYHLEISYLKHMQQHDPIQLCRKCGISFPTLLLARKHEMTHSKDIPYKCPICSQEIKHRTTYSTHMKRHKMTPEQRNTRQFSCEICGKTCNTFDNLKIHKFSHTNERTQACSQCDKTFKSSRCLKNHIQIKHDGRRSICTICAKKFVTGNALKRHMRLHTGEQPYKCQLCPKSFCDQSNYHGHMLSHSNMRTQVCKHCGMEFKQRTYLYYHIKTKHPDVKKNVMQVSVDLSAIESKMAE